MSGSKGPLTEDVQPLRVLFDWASVASSSVLARLLRVGFSISSACIAVRDHGYAANHTSTNTERRRTWSCYASSRHHGRARCILLIDYAEFLPPCHIILVTLHITAFHRCSTSPYAFQHILTHCFPQPSRKANVQISKAAPTRKEKIVVSRGKGIFDTKPIIWASWQTLQYTTLERVFGPQQPRFPFLLSCTKL